MNRTNYAAELRVDFSFESGSEGWYNYLKYGGRQTDCELLFDGTRSR